MTLQQNINAIASYPNHNASIDSSNEDNSAESFHQSFLYLISELGEHNPMLKGALFACNTDGIIMESHVFSDLFTNKKASILFSNGVSWDKPNMGLNAVSSSLVSLKAEQTKHSDHSALALKSLDSLAVPIFSTNNKFIGILAQVATNINIDQSMLLLKNAAITFKLCLTLNIERKLYNQRQLLNQKEQMASQKRNSLFQASKNLYTKIDADSVLSEVLKNLGEIYPSAEMKLFLSQDNDSNSLPVVPFIFDETTNDQCTRAFMEGQILSSHENDNQISIYAPLCGRQGVYGVLNLLLEQDKYDESDLKLISILTDSAGTAFENAKLYEQSNLLIKELRLINEITRRLNQSLKSQDIFNFASKELLSIFNADYGCILKFNDETKEMIVQASNLPAISNEIFSIDYGYSGVVYKTKESIIISDYDHKADINSRLMEATNSRSLMASPILVNSRVLGVILLTHRNANFFSFENFRLLQVIAGHIGLAMTNASLHAEVRRMVVTDYLTGLYSRSYLDEHVNLSQKKDFSGSLIIVDIDFFKSINDTYGHQVGDKVLMQVSKIITASIRESDIAARWGGEEFAIYLPQSTMEQTMYVAERIRIRISEETDPGVSISCGISEWNWKHDKISVELLFHKADMALYLAKDSGRNRIIVG